MATDVGLYVQPAHRRRGTAIKLMEYAEKCLKILGVNFITHGHKGPAGGPDLDKFFRRRGYKPYAVEYMKEIAPLEKSK
jgi:GNAT superfamily N-acetyltransferase